MALALSKEPCIVCGFRQTIGVGYSHPEEVKFWCAEHLPEEFRPKVRERSDQEMFDAWAEIEAARERRELTREAALRGENADD